jgi:D-inositol-3-phosphate glycosyltransferase
MTLPSVTVDGRTAPLHKGPFFFRPLRIAMLSIHSSPLGELGTEDTGGMSVYVRELSLELGRAGHRVDIFTCAGSGTRGTDISISENVRVIRLRAGNGSHVGKNTLFGHLPEIFLALEAYAEANRVSYDFIHSHYWLSGCIGRMARDRWSVPHVSMFHTAGIAKRIACGREREPNVRLLSEKRLAHTCDRILTSTEREKDMLMRYYGVGGENIRVVPCGVNLERFRPVARDFARKELGMRDSGFVVLYVGRFAPVKGLERLLAAAAHLRSHQGLKFVIIGGEGRPTPAFREFGRLVKKASIDGMVSFRGRVEHDLLPLYYSAADVLVVPSYYESFGLVALESLACGTPVIAWRVGAMDRLIRNGETGLVMHVPGPRYLATEIEGLMTGSSWIPLSREAIRGSVLGYGWSGIASAVAREYLEIQSQGARK